MPPPLIAATILVAANVTCFVGGLGGGDIYRANFTIQEAANWCRNQSKCASFWSDTVAFKESCDWNRVLDIHFVDAWGARRVDTNASRTNWRVSGPRPPPPPPPYVPPPPNPCAEDVTKAPKFHLTNLGTGPHDVNAIFLWKGMWHVMHQANWTDWAHLVSRDLATWTRLSSALSPNGEQ